MIPSQQLFATVRDFPGRTVHELCAILEDTGLPPVHKSVLNSQLYEQPSPFVWLPGVGNGRHWYLRETDLTSAAEVAQQMQLYPWQIEALQWWNAYGYRGVIEAVTGAGKTRLALAATVEQLKQGKPVVIVVPTKELLYQWKKEVVIWLLVRLRLGCSIGLLGDNHNDIAEEPDILIATSASACKQYLLPNRYNGLLIADEVHRYGSQRWSLVLESTFDRRLGLTGTYEREDRGIETYLEPYFGTKVFEVDYARAKSDGVIAPFKIAYVGVSFTDGEAERYEEYDDKAYRYRTKLVSVYGLPGSDEPFGEFMRQVQTLSQGGHGEATGLARSYLSAFSKRRALLADSVQKKLRILDLSDAVKLADRSIVFAQTQSAASMAVKILRIKGVNGAVLDSSMDMSERQEVFAAFEDRKHELVAAPRLLDEGIDVPAADLAIVLASNRNRRQLVQRLGRVIRKKEDGRMARLVVLYVEGTSEDPQIGANEDFMYLVQDVADDIVYFNSSASASKLCAYLNDWYV